MEARNMEASQYIGDAVYCHFDGYNLVLTTGSHDINNATNVIALEPCVMQKLIEYHKRLIEKLALYKELTSTCELPKK